MSDRGLAIVAKYQRWAAGKRYARKTSNEQEHALSQQAHEEIP